MFERRGEQLTQRAQAQFVRYLLIATLPLLVGMWAASRPFLEVFTARQYWVAAPVVSIVAAGTLLSAFSQILSAGLSLHKRTRVIMENSLAAAAFKLVVSVLVVPRWGYVGAAYSTLASYGVLLALTWWRSPRTMRITLPWAALLRIAVASAGMGAVLLLVFGSVTTTGRWAALGLLAGEAAAGAVVYVALCAAFGAVRRDEWAFVRQMGAKGLARLRGSARPRD
jgi:O-antigen/teichoic acid export membrane protein